MLDLGNVPNLGEILDLDEVVNLGDAFDLGNILDSLVLMSGMVKVIVEGLA